MPPPAIVVNIVDEGYYKKFFRFSTTADLKKPLNAYRSHICTQCSDVNMLEFWFETTKVSDNHTAKALGMQDGDVIDVRISQPCTRGACPIPVEQTLPNIHYIATPPTSAPTSQQHRHRQLKSQYQSNKKVPQHPLGYLYASANRMAPRWS
ncbi:Small ubiquitin-related modifier 1 [Vermiconidia calcicola]|uniref:Small ubiquitin-related modifier 1 n=1 Tax=Vermiconidia calcicola TaxID=1690605 RepID=A0ACC3N9F7_9PEZI|nr:Small ubiquitin-related modifier 1 [Vermiconidia calcicola]